MRFIIVAFPPHLERLETVLLDNQEACQIFLFLFDPVVGVAAVFKQLNLAPYLGNLLLPLTRELGGCGPRVGFLSNLVSAGEYVAPDNRNRYAIIRLFATQ